MSRVFLFDKEMVFWSDKVVNLYDFINSVYFYEQGVSICFGSGFYFIGKSDRFLIVFFFKEFVEGL